MSLKQMLPFGGQGSNQAIEDGGALGFLLGGVDSVADIPSRLLLFDRVRRKRASRVQVLSKVRIGKEKEVQQELQLHAESHEPGKLSCLFPIFCWAIFGC